MRRSFVQQKATGHRKGKTMDCIFCKIVSGDLKGDVVFENDSVLAFNDLNPQAPHHILIIPKEHLSTLNDFSESDVHTFGQMGQAAKEIAKNLGVSESGYRVVVNCGEGAGQTVFHTHMHFLSGRSFGWPPG